jgi:hypothetical protein
VSERERERESRIGREKKRRQIDRKSSKR